MRYRRSKALRAYVSCSMLSCRNKISYLIFLSYLLFSLVLHGYTANSDLANLVLVNLDPILFDPSQFGP